MTTFDLWPIPLGGGGWGAGTNKWHPETPASYESLPSPLVTQIPTLWIHSSWGRGRGGALLLDRCRAFDLFASVDAHLCFPHSYSRKHGEEKIFGKQGGRKEGIVAKWTELKNWLYAWEYARVRGKEAVGIWPWRNEDFWEIERIFEGQWNGS